jgi:hypothetical protein
MNKQEAQKELDALKLREAELLAVINAPEVTPEQRFLQLMEGLTVKINKVNYPDSIFYFRNGEFMFEIENDKAFLNYELFWGVFENEFNMDYTHIKDFTRSMLKEHFKMKVVKTLPTYRKWFC